MRPRPPASQGLRAANHARDKDVEQVRRLLSTQPKPKAASAGGAAGPTTAASATPGLSGGNLIYQGWTFDTDPFGSSVAGPSLSAGEFDTGFTVAEAGWYSYRFKQTVWFNVGESVPNGVQVELNNERLDGIPDFFWSEALVDNYFMSPGTVVGAVIDRSMGPTWCAAGDIVRPGMFWVGSGYNTSIETFGLVVYVSRVG